MVSPKVAEAMAMRLASTDIIRRGSFRVKKARAAKIRPGTPATRKAVRQPYASDRGGRGRGDALGLDRHHPPGLLQGEEGQGGEDQAGDAGHQEGGAPAVGV